MAKADALSRRAGHDQGKADNEDMTVLKFEWFRMISINTNQDILNRIKKIHRNCDKSVLKALAQKETDWEETEEGIVTWKGRIYVLIKRSSKRKLFGNTTTYPLRDIPDSTRPMS